MHNQFGAYAPIHYNLCTILVHFKADDCPKLVGKNLGVIMRLMLIHYRHLQKNRLGASGLLSFGFKPLLYGQDKQQHSGRKQAIQSNPAERPGKILLLRFQEKPAENQ